MVEYDYKCSCGNILTKVYKKIPKYKPCSYLTCKCGKRASRIPPRINTDLVNNIRWSNSMGVNIRQIPEAMKKYPGSVYNEKGQLEVRNRRDKIKKAKERGLSELD